MQSFRDLESSAVWFHYFLRLYVFQQIICNWPKVGKERNCRDVKEVVKITCLEKVNAISLARFSLITHIISGELGNFKFFCMSRRKKNSVC